MKWHESPWLIACAVLGVVVLICVLAKVATGVRNPVARETIAQSGVLLQGAERWAAEAQQDSNPVIALMHACYGKAFATALRRVLSDDQIQKAHSVSMVHFEQKLTAIEQKALANIRTAAPDLLPEGGAAVRTGWLE